MNPFGNFEPFIDPVKIERFFIKKSPESDSYPKDGRNESWLITSPEYNLKTILPDADKGIFQIAHCFREGDTGRHHSVEFLMLEWYRKNFTHKELISETLELISFLKDSMKNILPELQSEIFKPEIYTIAELFRIHCDPEADFSAGISKTFLIDYVKRKGLHGKYEDPAFLRYDELFFSVFLNEIEPNLNPEQPVVVTDYPPELRANSRITGLTAARFEIYWKGVELANGYFEETDPSEQVKIFNEENELRRKMNKPEMRINEDLILSLQEIHNSHIPVSGIALGVDRLLMVLCNKNELKEVSPFY
jgi:elongation factor P--(R)-beta-lysine ligase